MNQKYTPNIEDYSSGTAINSMKLIHLVRQHEVLYNSEAEGYSDKNHKIMIWERLHSQLFPEYESLNEDCKAAIRLNVRRRWKGLRDAIAREVRKTATVENYVRKKESPLVTELEFLIPYIRSTHCNKLANALGLRENWASPNSTLEREEEPLNDQELDDLIDLTDADEFYVKADVKDEFFGWGSDEGSDGEGSAEDKFNIAPTSSHPQAVMATPVFCTLASFTGGEFVTSNIVCTDTDTETPNSDEDTVPAPAPAVPETEPVSNKRPHREEDTAPVHVAPDNDQPPIRRARRDDDNVPVPPAPEHETAVNKRARTEETDIQAKILQSLSNLEARDLAEKTLEDDEDRMFMLSMVSAMKRVPAAKKILVKAEITAIIARGTQ